MKISSNNRERFANDHPDIAPKLLSKFWKFNEKNPHILTRFMRYTAEARNTRKEFSAWAVMNRVRWDDAIGPSGEEFKVPNDYIAIYARLAMWLQPLTLGGFFRTKRMKATRGIFGFGGAL
jgi:hypothetical protein